MWTFLCSALYLLGLCFLGHSPFMGSRTWQESWPLWGDVSSCSPHPYLTCPRVMTHLGHCTEEPQLWLNPQSVLGAVLLHIHCHVTTFSPHSPHSPIDGSIITCTQYTGHVKPKAHQHGLGGLLKQIPGPHPQRFWFGKSDWGPRICISNKLIGATDSTLNNTVKDDLERLSGA